MLDAFEFYGLVQALMLFIGASAVLYFVQQHQQARVLAMQERCEAACDVLDQARSSLAELAGRAGQAGGEQVAQLEAEIAALQAAVRERDDQLKEHAGSGDREEQLKQLVQQFTRDSREMLQCIRQLEDENAELRTQLGGDA